MGATSEESDAWIGWAEDDDEVDGGRDAQNNEDEEEYRDREDGLMGDGIAGCIWVSLADDVEAVEGADVVGTVELGGTVQVDGLREE